MKAPYDVETRKRLVNLTLNEGHVVQVHSLTDNLSGAVESLLTDYVEHERRQRNAKARSIESAVAMWNAFNARHGSFANEYSSL